MIVEEVVVTGTYTPQATKNKTSELTRPRSPVEMEMEKMLRFPTLDITVPGSPREGRGGWSARFRFDSGEVGHYLHSGGHLRLKSLKTSTRPAGSLASAAPMQGFSGSCIDEQLSIHSTTKHPTDRRTACRNTRPTPSDASTRKTHQTLSPWTTSRLDHQRAAPR
jgi:hypothetical protein